MSALAAPATAQALPRLHATRGSNPAILTDDGRQALLRGVNVNQLGDYWQQRADIPATLPLTKDDFAGIAAEGMDVVRLIVHWSALEPQRGTFDEAYLARIKQAVTWARNRGIYVVLDMHQDAWGKYIASPPGETCLPGFTHQQGWDGAPRWATITDGLPTCRIGTREIAPAVGQAFTNFYLDRNGIQARLVATWARLAKEFAADPTVAGYDLLNEPNPGYFIGATDATLLGLFYQRTLAAIRAAESSVPGGFSHIGFFEPGVIWSAAAVDTPPLAQLVGEPNLVFAPHLYAESITLDQTLGVNAVTVEQGFDLAALVASLYGTTVWSGEWGWFGDPSGAAPKVRRYAAQEDAHLWGGAWWDWKQSCGDPHQFSDGDDTTPGDVSPSLNRFACPGNVPLGIPTAFHRILARPYVRLAPGRIDSLASDPDAATAVVRGTDSDAAGSCKLKLWVPDARPGQRPAYTGTNVKGIVVAAQPGGWMVTACATGGYELRPAGSGWVPAT